MYFPKPRASTKVKFELDLINHATKHNIKTATGVDTSPFAKKADLVSLKTTVDSVYSKYVKK